MKIKAIGDTKTAPLLLATNIDKAEESTADYDSMFLNIAIAYGGQKRSSSRRSER